MRIRYAYVFQDAVGVRDHMMRMMRSATTTLTVKRDLSYRQPVRFQNRIHTLVTAIKYNGSFILRTLKTLHIVDAHRGLYG